MLEITAKLKTLKSAYDIKTGGSLSLTFEERSTSGAQVKLDSGEEVVLRLPRNEVLRGGDLVTASDGRVIEVRSRPEKLLQVEASPVELAKLAYRLGNLHVPMEAGQEAGQSYLRVPAIHELEEFLKTLGATARAVEAAFEPEAGGHHDDHHDHAHCDHDHGHGHGDHDHGHDHSGHRH
jgi:urease accessory protein